MANDNTPPAPTKMKEEWDVYWSGKNHTRAERSAYDVIARFYRNQLIRPTLNRAIKGTFAPGASLLHAGSGGGEVDADIVNYARVTALDISPKAAALYKERYGDKVEAVVGNIFELGSLGREFDGIYNLGVMEHFSEDQIVLILKQFRNSLRQGGRIVLFWPPVYGLSVIALHGIHFVLNKILRRNIALHPAEPTKVSSKKQVERLLSAAGFEYEKMEFGLSDAFTYCVVTALRR